MGEQGGGPANQGRWLSKVKGDRGRARLGEWGRGSVGPTVSKVESNLTFNDFWRKKDVSNNLYYTSGKIGIGVTKPKYDLDVLNNINCFEMYRNV